MVTAGAFIESLSMTGYYRSIEDMMQGESLEIQLDFKMKAGNNSFDIGDEIRYAFAYKM